jgi:hypothetical protein
MSIKMSPLFANYGYHPHMGVESHQYTKVEAADKLASQRRQIHKKVQAAMTK